MNQNLPNYDEKLGFRRVHPEDWLQPDIPGYFPGWKHQKWVETFTKPALDPGVPFELQRMFEASRGAIIYGWFFYPLLTLGLEQSWRVIEAAARIRCDSLGKGEGRFFDHIRTLVSAGILSAEDEPKWQAIRKLRNHSSHPQRQTIWDPGQAYNELQRAADWINALFSTAFSQTQPIESRLTNDVFPSRNLTEQMILQIIKEHGGSVHIRDAANGWNIYDELAARLGVSIEARRRPTEGTGEAAWRPEVGFCRKNLEQRGSIQPTEQSGRGIWALAQ